MEEVVISGPGYDSASTNVPGYTQEQLQSFLDGTNKGPVPEGAQSKANSWQRVTKVVRTSSSFPSSSPSFATSLTSFTLVNRSHAPFEQSAARREAQNERCICIEVGIATVRYRGFEQSNSHQFTQRLLPGSCAVLILLCAVLTPQLGLIVTLRVSAESFLIQSRAQEARAHHGTISD